MRKIQFTSLVSLFALLVVVFTYSLAKADPPIAVFELDGDAVYTTACTSTFPTLTPSLCKDDWDLLNGDGQTLGLDGKVGAPGGSLTRTFVAGTAAPEIFTQGGSKDTNDISSWRWKLGSTPDKDDITNGYAAAYKSPDPSAFGGPGGHYMLIFGADRFAVNGDSNIGFWFFQQNVHTNPDGTFSGLHSPRDLFIVSAFTQGGGVSTITVYSWDTSCNNQNSVKNPQEGQCADSNLKVVYISAPSSTCANGNEGCSIVNSAGINVSWPYLAKFGSNSTTIPQGGFYEGGLDITDIFTKIFGDTASLPCFSSFLIETRSSQTTSAVLKDFIAGAFNICGMGISKACADPNGGSVNPDGESIHFEFTGAVTNTGIGALSNVTIVDTLPTGATTVKFYTDTSPIDFTKPLSLPSPLSTVVCPTGSPVGATCVDIGSLNAAAVAYWGVEFDAKSTSVTNDASARAAATDGASPAACTSGGTVCTSKDGMDTCTAHPQGVISIVKSCGVPNDNRYPNAGTGLPGTQLITTSGLAAVQVNFSGTITNSGLVELTNVAVSDSPNAVITVTWPGGKGTEGTLPPNTTAYYSGSYLPNGIGSNDALGIVAGRYVFSDEIKVGGAHAALGTDPTTDPTKTFCTSAFDAQSPAAQSCSSANCHMCPGSPTGLCGGD
jgi:uncharacterized repeat protein (TIGR01451 family)